MHFYGSFVKLSRIVRVSFTLGLKITVKITLYLLFPLRPFRANIAERYCLRAGNLSTLFKTKSHVNVPEERHVGEKDEVYD